MVWGPIQRCAPNSSEKPKSDHWYLRHRFREPESSTSAVRTSGWAPGQNSCPHFWVSGQHLSVDKGSAKGVVRVHKGMGVSVCERACSRLRVPLGRSSGSGAGVCTVCMCFRVSEPCLSDEDAGFVLSMRAPEMG